MALRQLGLPATDSGFDIWAIFGQSNAAGTNGGADTNIDVIDADVWSYGYTGTYANQIVPAAEPLAQQGRQNNGVGPGMPFSKWVKGYLPRNRKVLLVPAAVAGSALVTTSTTGNNTWNPTVGAGGLYQNGLTQLQGALAAAGANARIAGILWLQGETEALGSVAASTYQSTFDSLITGYRSALGLPALPFLVLGYPPEDVYQNGTGSTWVSIAQVHANTPTRQAYSSFTPGPAGYGWGDNLHYTATGQRILGRAAAAGYPTALANATTPAVFTLAIAALITGATTVGSVLTANAAFSTTPDTTTYQWYRAGVAISGATGSTYTLVSADNANTISVTITGTKAGFTTLTTTSPSTVAVTTPGSINYADNFNRTSTTTLGTTSTGGATWTALAGTWGTDGAAAYNIGNTTGALAVVDSTHSDHTAQVTVSTADSGTGLLLRCTDAANWIVILWDATGTFSVYRNVAGSLTYVSVTGTTTSASGDTVKCVMSGSTGTIYRNGTQVATFSDSTTGTKAGIRADHNTGRLDNFSLTA